MTGSTLGVVTDSRTYSPFGELENYSATVSGSPVFETQFTRDNLGRITQKVETIGGTTDTYDYTYDVAGRLTEVKKNGLAVETYTYDSNGNRLSFTDGTVSPAVTTTGTYDDQDRLLSYGDLQFTYSKNGELETKTNPTLSQTASFSYDVLGNLKNVTLPNGDLIEYVIDGQNRRVGKKVNGTLVQGFLYQNQLNPVAELDGTGVVVARFVYGTRANVPDYMVKGGTTYRIISDHLGTVRLVINTNDGTIAQQIDYNSFGDTINDTNPGFQPFGFGGGLYDGDTGLTRFGARDYEAQSGRWTIGDSVKFNSVTNFYTYAQNDPINLIDLNGYRPLTTNEKNFLNNYFGNSLDTNAIDVDAGVSDQRAYSIFGDDIRLPQHYFKNNNPECEVDLSNNIFAAVFAHEAVHVWQRQHGEWVTTKGFFLQLGNELGINPYDYQRSDDPTVMLENFKNGNVEQQGKMVQDFVYEDITGADTSEYQGIRDYLKTR